MKISDINVAYLESMIRKACNKKIVLWGAGKQIESFIDEYCGTGKLLPDPSYILETTRKVAKNTIRNIEVVESIESMDLRPDNTLIIITAGLMELQGRAVSQEFYYFPMIHRRSIEAFHYLRSNADNCDRAISLLADQDSKYIYKKTFENIINGVLWDQHLFSPSPYFGNELIDKIPGNGIFVFAGAFNGKHLIRARKNNAEIKILAMEPSKHWFDILKDKFINEPKLELGNALFWNENTQLGYDEDTQNNGLGASIVSDLSKATYLLEATTIDEVVKGRPVSEIALDIEGAEQKALQGAIKTIKRDRPRLCVCLYHSLDDYFNLPQIIAGYGGYKLHVKQHSTLCPIETVLYALPSD